MDPLHRDPDAADASGGLLARAASLARRAHDGQRRDDGVPYITHPEGVAAILERELSVADARILSAAWLHDVLEDTAVSRGEMEREVGPLVTSWVEALTKQPPGKPRDVRIAEDLERVRAAGPEAVVVKIADRMHNLRSIRGKTEAHKRRRFLDETRRHFLPFVAAARPDLLDRFRAGLLEAERLEAAIEASESPRD